MNRFGFSAILLAALVLPFTGCGSSEVDSIQINPATQSVAAGQTVQFTAAGSYGHGSHPSSIKDVTSMVTWSSSAPAIATISSSGLATAVSAGSSTITASMRGFTGLISNTATVTVTAAAGTTGGDALLSIVVMPSSITVNDLLGNGQFLAYGTFSKAPTVMDITNGYTRNGVTTPVSWVSTAQDIFPVNSSGATGSTAGLVTAVGSGGAGIYAVATNSDGTVIYSPSVTFNCPYVAYVPATNTTQEVLGSCNEHTVASSLLATLTVFNAGLNTTNWQITADSNTGTPNVIHCGPGWTLSGNTGGSVCMATYPVGATVVLKAAQTTGSTGTFGGWSWDCSPSDDKGNLLLGPVFWTAAEPNYCTVTLGPPENTSNLSVGAIFN